MPSTHDNNQATATRSAEERSDLGLVLIVGAAVVFFQWLLPMVSGLWIDELGTFWVIDGDLGSTMDKAWRFHGQTPLYYTLLWGTTRLIGTSEIAMRLPSLVAMASAAVILYRMARRNFGRDAATLAAAGFVVLPAIASAAGDARPYALAILAAVLATDVLDRWHRTPRLVTAVAYGAAAAVVVYTHYVFATILIAHLAYHLWGSTRAADRPTFWRQTVAAAATFAIVMAPTVPQVTALLGRKEELTFSPTPPLDDLIGIWALPILIVMLLGVVTWRMTSAGNGFQRLPISGVVLFTLGFVVPPLTLFVMGNLTDVVLWTRRYWLVAFPFGAVLFGALLASLLGTPSRVSRGAMILLGLALVSTSSFAHSAEDWPGAVAAANRAIDDPSTPVLLYVNLIEATNPDFFADEERRSYLSSPVRYYPVDGSVIPIPWAFPTSTYPQRIAPTLSEIADQPAVVLITNRTGGDMSSAYISGWLIANGYQIAEQTSHGLVKVTALER